LAFKTHEIIDHIIYYLRNAAVKIESIDVAETIKNTKALIETEASLSLDLKEAISGINNLDSTRDRWGWCKDEAAWLYASRASGKNRN
jgi:hypothetical protein